MYKITICLFVLILVGCSGNHSESQYESDFTTPVISSLKVLSLTSNNYYFSDKQTDVSARLVATLGAGNLNIVSVQTSYTDTYLTAAKIMFKEEPGEGNNLRLIFIWSDKHYYNNKQSQVKQKFDEVVNDSTLNIVKVQTIYESGYLVAAEVYYKVS